MQANMHEAKSKLSQFVPYFFWRKCAISMKAIKGIGKLTLMDGRDRPPSLKQLHYSIQQTHLP